MISREYIQAWKTNAPWGSNAQVEQDLIISRALCELYSEKKIRDTLAFRGGTSLQKIFFEKPARYIDVTSIRHDYLREGKFVSMGHGNGPK